MHARSRSISALLVGLVATVLTMTGSAADAAPVSHAGESACQKPAPRNDDTIHIQGCLTDLREKPPKPVPDVKFTVEDDQGKAVGEGTSNASGVFDINLGKSIDVLGNTYTVNLDKKSLPEGAALRNPKQVSLKVTPKLSS